MKHLTILVFVVLLSALSRKNADAQIVSFPTTSHTVSAHDVSNNYSGTCANVKYQIDIQKDTKKVEFITTRSSPIRYDISSTEFGKTLISKAVFGNFGIGCGNQAMVLNFMGVQLHEGSDATAVSYHFVINEDGKVVTDRGLTNESFRIVNSNLIPQ